VALECSVRNKISVEKRYLLFSVPSGTQYFLAYCIPDGTSIYGNIRFLPIFNPMGGYNSYIPFLLKQLVENNE